MKRTALLSITACAAFLAGCSTNPETAGDAPPLTLTEVLRLGDESAGDTILFAPIHQIAVNSRGEIIVVEQRPAAVRVFRGDGAYLADIGREGEGPGEFRYLGNAVTGPADSVYVWDFVFNRVMVYEPNDLSFARSVKVEDEGAKQVNVLIGVVNGSWLMAMSLPSFLPTAGGTMTINEDNHYEVRKVNLDGSYGPDVIATMRAQEMIYNLQAGGGFNFVSVPFARSGTWTVVNDLLYYGWNDSISIAVTSIDGSTQETISYEHDPVTITDAEMQAAQYRESALYQELVDGREPHKAKPAFQTFVVDEAGHVWIKLSSIEDAADANWLIMDMEGQAVGMVSLPIFVDLKVIRESHAYGVEQQEGGAPMVVAYKIQE